MTESLLSRLSALTSPSRELDAEIALAEGWSCKKMKGDQRPYWRKSGETNYYNRELEGAIPAMIAYLKAKEDSKP